MNESWFQDLANRALASPPWPDPRFPPSAYYRFLLLLAQEMKPSLSVELGLGGGGGSFHLAVGWPEGTVVGVDRDPGFGWDGANWAFIEETCSNFVRWQGDSVESAPEIAKLYGAVDVLFIDTTHEYGQTMAEWAAWEPFMAERAVVCMDDLFRWGMDRAWADVPWPDKLKVKELHDGGEVGPDSYGDGCFGIVWRS
jgi:predicted O-methyltransferase YrrM